MPSGSLKLRIGPVVITEEVRAEPDGHRALQILLDHALDIAVEVSPIYGVIQEAAADTEGNDLLAERKRQRHVTLTELAKQLVAKRGFAAGLSPDRAADILYALVSVDLYRVLVVERGWPLADWKAWAYDTAAAQLFPAPRRASR